MIKLLTIDGKSSYITDRRKALTNSPNYLFVAKSTPFINDAVQDNISEADLDRRNVYDKMLFGKKITDENIFPVIARNDWVTGTVYDRTGNYYVQASSGSNINTYKCLKSPGTPSTQKPTLTSLTPFELSDGYIWKYMFTVTSTYATKYGSAEYFPVVENQAVTNAAIPGTIDTVKILNTGTPYTNFVHSAFRAGDIENGGSQITYLIPSDNFSADNYYNGCILKITSGSQSGQYRKIIDYDGATFKLTLESKFDTSPTVGDTYEITPAIVFLSNGEETEEAVARTVIDPSTGIIQDIEVLNMGAGYRKVQAQVGKDPSVTVVVQAEVKPILSSIGGNGSKPDQELGVKDLLVYVELSGDENGNVPVEGTYRTVGLLKSPLYDNLNIQIQSVSQIGSFDVGETVSQVKETKMVGTVTTVSGNTTVTGSGTDFQAALAVNDVVMVSTGSYNHLDRVTSVASNTSIELMSQVSFANTSATISKVEPKASGKIVSVTSNNMILTDVETPFDNGLVKLVGGASSASVLMDIGEAGHNTIEGRGVNGFITFNQLERLEGTFSTAPFEAGDTITQGSSTAIVHHVDAVNDIVYITERVGEISPGVVTSASKSFTVDNKYNGDLKLDSGTITYQENVLPITRDETKKEVIKIIMEM